MHSATPDTAPVDALPEGAETYLIRAQALVRSRADLFAVNLVRGRRAGAPGAPHGGRRARRPRAASTQLRLPLPPRLC